jgi:Tol biopolymer transport system component
MGEVWEAYDRRLRTTVALKLVASRVAKDADTRERFNQEVLMARQVRHPNVAAVYDLFEEDDRCFFTMELVPGRSLSELLEEPLEIDRALSLARDIARGLAAMHEAGLVHRDIKPANIRVTPDGRAVLLDLGIAKDLSRTGMTQVGWVVGTPDYMAPEQAQGRMVTAAADIYAFGLVLYRMLTGQRVDNRALQGETQMTLAAPSKINPETPPWLDRVLAVCLEPKPQRRYQDARKLLEDLEQERRPTTQRTVTVSHRTLVGVTGGTALVLAVLLAFGILWWLRREPEVVLHNQPLIDPAGLEAGAALSPDGRQVVYAGFRNDGAELYRTGTEAGATAHRLTTSRAQELEASFSQGGDLLALSVVSDGLGDRIGVMPFGNAPSGPRWLEQPGYRPRWSPDDTSLLVHVGRSDPPTPDVIHVPVGDSPGGRQSLRALAGLVDRTALSTADWWDGERVVAVVGSRRVVRLDLATGGLETLFEAPGPVVDLCVDRLMKEVAVLTTGAAGTALHLWREGEIRQPWPEGDFTELTGCQGQRYLLTQARPNMRIFAARLGARQLVPGSAAPLNLGTAVGAEEREFMPDLSPDGRWLAYISAGSGQDELVLHDLESGDRRVISREAGELRWPSFSPDGTLLAYNSKVEGDGDVLVYDLQRETETNLTQSFEVYEGAPDWFPDGASLAINEKRGGQWDLVRITYPSGERQKLTDDKVVDIDPAVHPSGERVAFHRDGVIHVLELATGDLVPLVPGGTPRWRADGAAVLFQANGDLWSVPYPDAGETATRLTFHPWPYQRLEGVWKFSVRGDRLVYSVVEHKNGRIVLLAPDGAPP